MKLLCTCKLCCEDYAESSSWDDDIGLNVCPDCMRNLKIADVVLRANGIPPIYKGPFQGNSNG